MWRNGCCDESLGTLAMAMAMGGEALSSVAMAMAMAMAVRMTGHRVQTTAECPSCFLSIFQ